MRRERWIGYLYLLPNFLGFLVFSMVPILAVFVMALYRGDFVSRFDETGFHVDAQYVGLDNFRRLFSEGQRPLNWAAFLDYSFRTAWPLSLICLGFAGLWVGMGRIGRDNPRVPIGRFRTVLLGLYVPVVLYLIAGWVLSVDRQLADQGPRFAYYTFNTVFLMAAIPFSMAGSLALAILLNRKLRGMVFFRTLYFLPSILAGIAVFLIWRWVYNPDVGLLNWALDPLLRPFGLQGPHWLTDRGWAKPALMLMGIWMAVGGYNMVLYLAALQGVDPTLYEAASLDGAGSWQQFRYITWPQLGPTTFFIFTTSLIGGFQIFDQPYVMTGGGPEGATTTIMFEVYRRLYEFNEVGYAAAIAVVLFFLILAVTLVNWRVGGRLVHY